MPKKGIEIKSIVSENDLANLLFEAFCEPLALMTANTYPERLFVVH